MDQVVLILDQTGKQLMYEICGHAYIHSVRAVRNPCLLVVCDVNCTVYRPKHAILPPCCV